MKAAIRMSVLVSAALHSLGTSVGAQTQVPPQSPNMTFFVTSAGLGKGADLGGLTGADEHCQRLGTAAGAGDKTWRAYLSTNAAGGPSTPAIALDAARGRTSRERSSRKMQTIFTAITTSSTKKTR